MRVTRDALATYGTYWLVCSTFDELTSAAIAHQMMPTWKEHGHASLFNAYNA